MSATCAGCGNAAAHLDQNFGEFWYGIAEKDRSYTDFSVLVDGQRISILGHQILYFCPECLRFAQQNCIEAQNALDQFAIALRRTALGSQFRYFTRREFASMKFMAAH